MPQKSVSAVARRALLKRSRDLLRPRLDRKVGPDEVLAGLDAAQRRELEEIHGALERIERGRFGTCEACSGKIEPALLEATPWRRTCRGCAATLPAPPDVRVVASGAPGKGIEAAEPEAGSDEPRPG
jgi:DksA/TraR C4-type zinc finger protein